MRICEMEDVLGPRYGVSPNYGQCTCSYTVGTSFVSWALESSSCRRFKTLPDQAVHVDRTFLSTKLVIVIVELSRTAQIAKFLGNDMYLLVSSKSGQFSCATDITDVRTWPFHKKCYAMSMIWMV